MAEFSAAAPGDYAVMPGGASPPGPAPEVVSGAWAAVAEEEGKAKAKKESVPVGFHFDASSPPPDGVISQDEMTRYLTSVFKVMCEKQPGTEVVPAEELAEATAEQAFEDADLDGDGNLTWEEFQAWYSKPAAVADEEDKEERAAAAAEAERLAVEAEAAAAAEAEAERLAADAAAAVKAMEQRLVAEAAAAAQAEEERLAAEAAAAEAAVEVEEDKAKAKKDSVPPPPPPPQQRGVPPRPGQPAAAAAAAKEEDVAAAVAPAAAAAAEEKAKAKAKDKKDSVPAEEAPAYRAGSRVEYHFRDQPGIWYRGVVKCVNKPGSLAIDFDDGDKRSRLLVWDETKPGSGVSCVRLSTEGAKVPKRRRRANCSERHGLRSYLAPYGSFMCDVCLGKQSKRATLWGCRKCDYDVCDRCFGRLKWAVAGPIPVPVPKAGAAGGADAAADKPRSPRGRLIDGEWVLMMPSEDESSSDEDEDEDDAEDACAFGTRWRDVLRSEEEEEEDDDDDDKDEDKANPHINYYGYAPYSNYNGHLLQAKQDFADGDSVEAKWKAGYKWYKARISAVNGDGTFAVRYDDGDFDARVEKRYIRM